MTRRYYQLVSALPALPHFRRAGRLPLSRLRLDQRLGLLHPDDAADLGRAEALISWSQQPVTRTTDELAGMYDEALAQTRSATLRGLLRFRMDMRTIVVALRIRRRDGALPGWRWGVGEHVRTVTHRWNAPDFGLDNVFPWIDEARVHLEQGHAMELEGLLMEQTWRLLGTLADRNPFGFEQVFGFAFRWDIVKRWLSYDAIKARKRFDALVEEVTRDHQNLFA